MVYDNFYDLCEILLDRNNYAFTPLYLNDFGDDNKDRMLSMQKLSFCVLSEFIQFKQLEKVIDEALGNFNFENQLGNLDDKTNTILENIVKKYAELIERLTLSQIIVTKKNMKVSLLKNDVSFVLSVILNNCGLENERLILAYLPILIFTFSVNHNQTLSNNLKKFHDGDKNQSQTIKSALTNIKLNPKTKVDTSKLSDNINKSNKLYMYTCFFIQTICTYKSNFVLSFLWFERNLGYFQYYLKANEYLEIINCIAECKLTGSDVSVSVTLSKKISEYYDEYMYKDVCNIISPIIDSDFLNDLKSECDNKNNIFNILETGLKIPQSEYEEINNSIISILTGINSSRKEDGKLRVNRFNKTINKFLATHHENRFLTFLVQYLYYSDLFYREKLIKENGSKFHHYFSCEKIISDDFVLKNVEFYDWLTSDCCITLLFPDSIPNYDDSKYHIAYQGKANEKLNDTEAKDSLLTINKVDEIIWKGSLIDKKGEFCLNLGKSKFINLKSVTTNNNINLNDIFNHSITVQSFNSINQNNRDKIYVFLGLNYFLNDNENSILENNLRKLSVCGLLDFQDFRPIFRNYKINELMEELEKTKMKLPDYCYVSCSIAVGITQGDTSISCSGSCSATVSSEAEQKDEK